MAELGTSAPSVTPGLAAPVARSPIAPAEPVTVVGGWEVSALRADGADLTLTDCTPLAKVAVASRQPDLRGVRFGRAFREEDGTLVVGSGPGEWLLIGPPGQAPALAATIGPDATGVDLTHGRALVRLTGRRAPDVLAKLSAIDLDDELVPDGAALRTAVATVATDLIRDDVQDGTRSYLLHCERSVGQHGEPVRHAPVLGDPAVATRATSMTVKSTGRPLGGPKNGPVAVPWPRTRTQMMSPDSTESSMVNEMSGIAP